ncbi:TRAP transporter substrate-binding protein [Rhodoplanes sp.]|uniref:TRAP transporter substrate-binding protein n=1 Tax=Rhodoplanes sp. TaxID=1968906 RepID=UPI0025F511EC|nr:TRAP transporter substrate-binding protein [Rhodoplanes sp.]
MLLTRKRLLASAAAAVGLAAAGPAAPAIAQNRRELRLASGWARNFPGFGTAVERLAKRISDMTDGRITVRVFAAGELVPAFEIYDAVANGVADMYHGVEFWWQGKSPAFNFYTTTPFGLTPTEIKTWVEFGGGQALWDELAAQYGVKSFLVGNPGVQAGGWFRREISSLDDFRGVKMRMGGFGGEVLRRVGASAVLLPGGDIFPALQSGTIDATEWVGPWNDLAMGFYRVAKFYYAPGWHEPSSNCSAGIGLKVWSTLSASDREIIKTACHAENDVMESEFKFNDTIALDKLVREHGVQLRVFSDDVLRALGRASREVVAEAGQKDPLTRRVHDSYMGFHERVRRVTEASDLAYLRARSLAYEA